jgi:D-glycero-D-manno-heptose 1,7-bisphosphate phosphatase
MNQIKVKSTQKKKATFLDRDGVINIDNEYVGHWCDFEFTVGIFDLLRYLAANDFLLFIITNQSAIARGFYTEEEFSVLTDKMLAVLSSEGIHIDKVYYCPHHPDYGNKKYRKMCRCRKPQPGMILDAALEYNVDLEKSILIGDNVSDIQAAISAGVASSFLLNPKTDIEWPTVTGCRDLYDCATLLKNQLVRSKNP